MTRWMSILWLGCLVVFGAANVVAKEGWLNSVNVSGYAGYTTLEFDLSEETRYKYFTLEKPDRVVVDLKNTKNRAKVNNLRFEHSAIKRIRLGERQGATLRIVFDLKEPVLTENITIPKASNQYQLGFQFKSLKMAMLGEQIAPASLEKIASPIAPKAAPKKVSARNKPADLRSVVVAIDAGHGGKDPGAIGPGGTKEKDVVLSISKKLAHAINKKKGYRAVMTRERDRYVSLAKRRELARDVHQADLFVSIHADSWKRKSARGASVYALSRKGASSTLARHLAAHEKILGVKPQKGMLNNVLADLAMEGSMEHSLQVGDQVLNELGGVTKLHKRKVEMAAFAVLKSPDVPSILVETGFLSNPKEERQLNSSQHQRKLVSAIADGIERYFTSQPPLGTWLAYWKDREPASHQIARGETLSGIAERYRVSQEQLKQINNLNSDLIRIGQVLYIPSS